MEISLATFRHFVRTVSSVYIYKECSRSATAKTENTRNIEEQAPVDSACTGNILRKTKGTKNDNNTNAKQEQKYNTSQTIEDNWWFMDTSTCRKTPGSVIFLLGAKKCLLSYNKQTIYFSILQTLTKQMQISKAAQNRLSAHAF